MRKILRYSNEVQSLFRYIYTLLEFMFSSCLLLTFSFRPSKYFMKVSFTLIKPMTLCYISIQWAPGHFYLHFSSASNQFHQCSSGQLVIRPALTFSCKTWRSHQTAALNLRICTLVLRQVKCVNMLEWAKTVYKISRLLSLNRRYTCYLTWKIVPR